MTKQYEDQPLDIRMGISKKHFDEHMANGQKGSVNGQTMAGGLVPSIDTDKGRNDLFSHLMSERIIRLDGPVDDTMAAIFCSQLDALEASDSGKEIKVYINSPGGSVTAGLAMYDKMRSINSPISTIVSGLAASMGSILSVAGDKRFMTPNAYIMIHQPSGGGRGTATDTGLGQEVINDMWDRLTDIYVAHTGIPHQFWNEILTRAEQNGYWINAEDGLGSGYVHNVIQPKKTTPYDPKEVAKTTGYNGRPSRHEELKETFDKFRDYRSNHLSPSKANDNNDKPAAPKKKNGSKGPK